jgi:hypothetical protein
LFSGWSVTPMRHFICFGFRNFIRAPTGPFDTVTYPALPTDGVTSVDRNGVRASNTPTNFAGQSGALAPPAPPPPTGGPASDVPALGTTGIALTVALLALLALIMARRSARSR